MIKIKAHLKLYKGVRATPFLSGYRPVFDFILETKTGGGQITLIEKDEFSPGEEGEVEINFISNKYLGEDFKVGKVFYFGEGGKSMGEGTVLEILKT
jgi:translation elongation factor EF-Tu-like GTPase